MSEKWFVPCLRGVMGDWVYYSALVRPDQLAARIIPSKEIRETKALDDFLQRELKPRVSKIVAYLRHRDDRFFGAVVIGVFGGLPDWVQLDLSRVAEGLGLPDVTAAAESLGLLVFSGDERMFAIDGQHRVAGIKQAFEVDPNRIRLDEYPVIFVAHRDDAQGKVRTRRLFCDINKNAVAVSEGDKVVIDEDDLAAVVTRRIYAEYPAFKAGEEIAVSEKKEQLSEAGKERFTSLLALHTVTKRLKKLFRKPRGTPDCAAENVAALQLLVTDFLNFAIKNEASLRHYFTDHSTTVQEERRNNRSLFFRPVGLELLARLYVHFQQAGKPNVLADGLARLRFGNPGGVLDGVLWNNGRIEASAKARNAALMLVLYLLGETTDEEEDRLQVLMREVTKDASYELPTDRLVAEGG